MGLFSFLILHKSDVVYGTISSVHVVLIIYVFFIWYRDWFGKNTFIYRLFMLPTARINVYLQRQQRFYSLF